MYAHYWRTIPNISIFFSLKIYDVSVSVGSILVCHFVNIYSFGFCLKERWFFEFHIYFPFRF